MSKPTNKLEKIIDRAYLECKARGDRVATIWDLLLALTKDRDALIVFEELKVNLEELRGEATALANKSAQPDVGVSDKDPRHSLGFQRVIERAQNFAKPSEIFDEYLAQEANGAHVLAALFGEHATGKCLRSHRVLAMDATSYLLLKDCIGPLPASPSPAVPAI